MRRKNTNYATYKLSKKGVTGIIHGNSRVTRSHVEIMPDYSLAEFRAWAYSDPKFNELFDDWTESFHRPGLKPQLVRIDLTTHHTIENIQFVARQDVIYKVDVVVTKKTRSWRMWRAICTQEWAGLAL